VITQPSAGAAGPITEKPILMSAPMALATLRDEKTQTRRVVRFKWPDWNRNHAGVSMVLGSNGRPAFTDMGPNVSPEMLAMLGSGPGVICPHGDQGDRLWVKETWRTLAKYDHLPPREVPVGSPIFYEASGAPEPMAWWGRIRQSIFCMRWMSRSVLEITDVRVQRLQEITIEDARAEGARELASETSDHPYRNLCEPRWSFERPHPVELDPVRGHTHCLGNPKTAFANLWESLNGEREGASWSADPWVWALSFRRVAP
jgi:hypothetical protein